jgi:hypothetical protein
MIVTLSFNKLFLSLLKITNIYAAQQTNTVDLHSK